MITVAQIAPLYRKAKDYGETKQLIAKLARLHLERCSMYLTLEEFDEILHWKLDRQYGRGEGLRLSNTDAVIRIVTTAALNIAHVDEDYETELRMGILCTLRGVGVPVASAVLALIYPEKFAVIDFRGWRQVFGQNSNGFYINDYKRYLHEIRKFSNQLGWSAQEVDHAIWEYDRRNS